ncbi:hypothetical protein SAY87_000618 [Trapa incisa]|uniref:Serine-rich protein-like protein n=1 Tax=Trapa incisa TaxID=236973 RepID=A0AAN7GTU1_9MYRT|nr:hypothetical protein SAY87_000618 [Trapa incisa]
MAFSSMNKSRGYGLSCVHGDSTSLASAAASSFASSTSSFFNGSSNFSARTTSSPHVRLYGHSSHSSPPVRISIDHPSSPGRSISVTNQGGSGGRPLPNKKKACMCSPTTHSGSFRCSLHKNSGGTHRAEGSHSASYNTSRSLTLRRSAMANSLVRICGVEGDLVRRSLSALIRPSSHILRRKEEFRPRPSRLSIMSKADDS